MKCEECKAFSRQSEKGGTCHFTDFGTVMNEDGKNCRSGRIVDSIYRRGRADEKNRIEEELVKCHNDSGMIEIQKVIDIIEEVRGKENE